MVNRCEWHDDTATWSVSTFNTKTGEAQTTLCDVLISATGVLNKWKWPDVPGIKDFRGSIAHSAHWDESIELKDKSVALIGNGYACLFFSQAPKKGSDSLHYQLGRPGFKSCPPSCPR